VSLRGAAIIRKWEKQGIATEDIMAAVGVAADDIVRGIARYNAVADAQAAGVVNTAALSGGVRGDRRIDQRDRASGVIDTPRPTTR